MSISFSINNTLIEEGTSFYLLTNGLVLKADVIRVLEPTQDKNGNKNYIFHVDATEDGENSEVYILSSGDPYIDRKVFPSLTAAQDYLTLPFEDGEKAYFLNINDNCDIEDALEADIKEVTVVVDPERCNFKHTTPIMQYNDCVFKVKYADGSVSKEHLHNLPFKTLFKTREEAEKEWRVLKLSSIAFCVAEIAADYLSKKDSPYAIDLTSFGKEIHDAINPIFKELISSDAYKNDAASMASMAEKIYNALNECIKTI